MTNDIEEKTSLNFYCKKCDYLASDKFNYTRHLSTSKHNKTRDTNVYCKICDYLAGDISNYKRHLTTLKHKRLNEDYENDLKQPDFEADKNFSFKCECGKSYKHKPSVYKHKKTCAFILENNSQKKIENSLIEKSDSQDNLNYKEMFVEMLNQNKELQKMIIKQNEEHNKQILELVPKINQNQNINVTNNITNIKDSKFDINIFLNEKCKDALSIDQFINKIQISLSDLLVTKDKGLIEGISNIFVENMKQLSLYERPLHCTDTKRETLYIKQDEWKKDENNIIVKDAIKQVAFIQSKNINNNWIKAHPNFMESSEEKDDYMKIVKNTMEDINNKEGKIVKNICKNVYLNNVKNE